MALIEAPSLIAMIPMVIFLVLTLTGKNYIFSVGIAAILGCILTGQGFLGFANIMVNNMNKTLGIIAWILMFGTGLGAIMEACGINQMVVQFVVKKLHVNTEKKAMLAVFLTSVIMTILIGTFNAANAVIAPIILPIVAAVGLTPTTVCFILFHAGLIGVTIGPFCSAVAAALGATGLSYGDYMLYAAIPYSVAWFIICVPLTLWIQKKTKGVEAYEDIETISEEYVPEKRTIYATIAFLLAFVVLLIYGIMIGSKMNYILSVLLVLSLIVSFFIDKPFAAKLKIFTGGMGKMSGMALSFMLTAVMIDTITLGGGWEALSEVITKLIGGNNRALLMTIASFVGGFGVEGAVATQMEIVNNLFWPTAETMGIPMQVWAIVLIAAVRITSIVYPSGNTAAHMGMAKCNNLKLLIITGWIIGVIMLAFTPIWGTLMINMFF